MNRKQTFCIFTGAVFFAVAGVFLQAERIGNDPGAWPGAGDVAICLSIILVLTAGAVFAFKELTRRSDIVLIMVTMILGVCGGLVCWFYHSVVGPKYTAQAAIEILPYTLKDPMSFIEADVDKDLYYQFRVAKAEMIQQQSLLKELLKRDKVRGTEWYKRLNHDVPDAVSDLEDNLSVEIKRDSNLMTVTMTCRSAQESAIIVNELVDTFIKMQHDMAVRGIRAQLAERTKQQQLIKAQLIQAEESLDTVRKGTAFAIEDAQYSHFLAATLIEIESEYGKLERKLSLLEAKLALLKSTPAGSAAGAEQKHSANLNETEDHITAITKQLEIVQQQRVMARREYKDLDNLRASYEKIKTVRDEKRSLLKDIAVNIEKLNMLFNDPEVSKVKKLGRATEPLQVDTAGVGRFIFSGVIGGLICGIWFGLIRSEGSSDRSG